MKKTLDYIIQERELNELRNFKTCLDCPNECEEIKKQIVEYVNETVKLKKLRQNWFKKMPHN